MKHAIRVVTGHDRSGKAVVLIDGIDPNVKVRQLDDSDVHLRAGDAIVQQATHHAWVNRGSRTCRVAFVLIDAAEPLPNKESRP